MKQAADEAGLELNMELPGAASNTIGTTAQVLFMDFYVKLFTIPFEDNERQLLVLLQVATGTADQDELSQRLARLRQI